MTHSPHTTYMSRAIELAKQGLYSTMPNPRVGCVIVKDNQVVGEGFHKKSGEAHAEIHALHQAGKNAKDATVYVTLEPCSHTGKTGPCVTALINAQVKTVVIASLDPNPIVHNEGVTALKSAGIEVVPNVLSEEARLLNPGFFKRMTTGRPWVICKLAMSVDGKTALNNGQSQWLTGAEAKAKTMVLRARSSAIMTGINTVIADNPIMNVRDFEPVQQPARVILDSTLKIPLDSHILQQTKQTGKTYIVHCQGDPKKVTQLEKTGITVKQLPAAAGEAYLETDLGSSSLIEAHALLDYLGKELQFNEVLLESGPTLSGHFLQHGLIDEFFIYLAPIVLGNEAQSLFKLPMLDNLDDKTALKIQSITPLGSDWCLHALAS